MYCNGKLWHCAKEPCNISPVLPSIGYMPLLMLGSYITAVAQENPPCPKLIIQHFAASKTKTVPHCIKNKQTRDGSDSLNSTSHLFILSSFSGLYFGKGLSKRNEKSINGKISDWQPSHMIPHFQHFGFIHGGADDGFSQLVSEQMKISLIC